MNKETFTKAMVDLLPSCEREAIPIWFSFAAECVDNEQFVNFVPETNKAAAIEKWLDCIYTGVYFVKKEFGEDTASKICNLSLSKSCIYPYEMKLAAEHIQNGGDISKISELSVDGMLDGPPPFFPRIEDAIDDMKNSPDITVDWSVFDPQADDDMKQNNKQGDMSGSVKQLRVYSPVHVTLFRADGETEALYNEAAQYKECIEAAMASYKSADYPSCDLMQYFQTDNQELEQSILAKVRHAKPDVMSEGKILYGVLELELAADLTAEELAAFQDGMEKQYYAGWGEAFEDYGIPLENGDEITLSLYHGDFCFYDTPESIVGQDTSIKASSHEFSPDHYGDAAKPKEPVKYSNLSLEEYLDKFDPLSDEDIGRYVPADGAVLRYSNCRTYRDGEHVGGGFRAGHATLEDIKADSFFTRGQFSRKLSLNEVDIGVTWYSYGEGEKMRDASEDEMTLACMGALDAPPGEEIRYTIKRNEVELPPVSPLTERGMSNFFTEAARLAEKNGFEVMEVKDDQLHIFLIGKPAIELNEGGGGASWQYNGDQYKAFNDKVSEFWKEIKAVRAAIPEVLYPADYPLVEQRANSTLEQDGNSPSLCQY